MVANGEVDAWWRHDGAFVLVTLGVRFGEGEALFNGGLGSHLVLAKVLDVSQCLTSKGLWRRRHRRQ